MYIEKKKLILSTKKNHLDRKIIQDTNNMKKQKG